MKQYILCIFLSMLTSSFLLAQPRSYQFKVMDVKNHPIAFSSVRVVSVLDTHKVVSGISDSLGLLQLNIQANREYFIKANAIGYKKYEKRMAIENNTLIVIKLIEDPNQLQQVVVTSSKALIRQEDDKSVVDPEPLAASSTNAMETIEKTPGIFTDADGQIFLNGMTPAGVQINGRDLKMSPSDLATLLKSLPPNVIQKIELIRTPSAKYDASGGGGIINIVLKKGVNLGMNGSVNTGLQQGKLGNQFIGFNLNNNKDQFSSYLNTNFSNYNGYTNNYTKRFLKGDTILQQQAKTESPGQSIYVGYGIGKTYHDKWELNYDGRIHQNYFNNTTHSDFYFSALPSDNPFGFSTSKVINHGQNSNINQSLRSKLKLDTLSGEWITDLSINYATNNVDQQYTNAQSIGSNSGAGNNDNDKFSFIAQTDLKKKWWGLQWEMGLKTSVLTFNNHANFTKTIAGVATIDNFRTSAYHYQEIINAGYLQASKTWDKIILKVGSRWEQTIMNGAQYTPKDTSFAINRTDAFPYVYLSRAITKIAGYELRGFLVYRKTISRPSYDFLNPYARYIDPYTYEIGNPLLKPQFTTNYEVNISVDDKPLFAYGINETTDIFTSVVYPSATNKQMTYRTYDNLGKNKEVYFRAIAAIPPGKKFFAVAGIQYNHYLYDGVYNNAPFNLDRASIVYFGFQSYKIDTRSVFTLHGFWRVKGLQQFYDLSDNGQISATINRQFLNKKLTITLSANDVFFTNNYHFTMDLSGIKAQGYRENDSRRYGLNIRYNFGFKPKEKKTSMFDMSDPSDK